MSARSVQAMGWLVLGLVLSGCAGANGAWLREPEDGISLGERMPSLADASGVTASPRSAEPLVEVEAEAEPVSRTRLRRTVTLGETIAPAPEPRAPATAANGAPVNVTVNNYVTVPSYAPAYGELIEPPARDVSRAPGNPPRSSAPARPAGNWPAARSYGPAFPFKSAPASPWQ